MRFIYILLSVLVAVAVSGQAFQFDYVQEVPGKTQLQLYQASKLAVVELYKSAKDVIQLDDPQSGTLVLKATMGFVYSSPNFTCNKSADGRVDYTVKIMTKDGRYRLQVEDFTHYSDAGLSDLGLITESDQPLHKWMGTKKCAANLIADIKAQCERDVEHIRDAFHALVIKDADDW